MRLFPRMDLYRQVMRLFIWAILRKETFLSHGYRPSWGSSFTSDIFRYETLPLHGYRLS